MSAAKSCRTCKHWNKPAGFPAYKDRLFPCVAPFPMPPPPDSIKVTLQRDFMERDDGKNCAGWTPNV